MVSKSVRFRLEVKLVGKIQLLLAVVQNYRALADSLQDLADAMVEGDTPATPEPEQVAAEPEKDEKPKKREKAVTLEQVRSVLVDKTHDGYTAEVQALLRKYGASKLSAIDPKNYGALLKDAEEIGNAS